MRKLKRRRRLKKADVHSQMLHTILVYCYNSPYRYLLSAHRYPISVHPFSDEPDKIYLRTSIPTTVDSRNSMELVSFLLYAADSPNSYLAARAILHMHERHPQRERRHSIHPLIFYWSECGHPRMHHIPQYLLHDTAHAKHPEGVQAAAFLLHPHAFGISGDCEMLARLLV